MIDKCINSNTHCFYLLYSDAMDKLVNCNEVFNEKDIIHADICKDLIYMRDDVCDGPLSYIMTVKCSLSTSAPVSFQLAPFCKFDVQ